VSSHKTKKSVVVTVKCHCVLRSRPVSQHRDVI